MDQELMNLYQAAKALITYIDKQDVFDRAAAGGCSGLDFHQSDAFYDLIVKTRGVISEVEAQGSGKTPAGDADGDRPMQADKKCMQLLDALQALTAHIERERAFDTVTDLGPVGFETHQSDAFIEVIRQAGEVAEEVAKKLSKQGI